MLCCKPIHIYLSNKNRLVNIQTNLEADLQSNSIKESKEEEQFLDL